MMLYFVCPLHEATAAVVDGNGNVTTDATFNGPGVGTAPYGVAEAVLGSRVYYKGGNPTSGSDTVLVTAPAGTVAQTGWVEKTQAEAQALFPLAGV